MRDTNEPFTVLSRGRPYRVAYLVDAGDCPPGQLDAIFDANFNLWGGRLNPIIPIENGEVPGCWWELLKYSDPDLVYTYVDLTDELALRISEELHPFSIRSHPPQIDRTHHPSLGVQPVRAAPIYRTLAMDRTRHPEPTGVVCSARRDWEARRAVLRNFGIIPHNLHPQPLPDTAERICISQDWDFARSLREISQAPGVVLPFEGSVASSRHHEPARSHYPGYCLVVGDSLAAWLYFWNRVFLLSDYQRSRWSCLCVSSDALDQSEFVPSLIEFLRRMIRSESLQPILELVHFNEAPARIESIRQQVAQGAHVPVRVRPARANEFPTPERSYCEFARFDEPWKLTGKSAATQQQARGRTPLLHPPRLDHPPEHEAWVLDLKLEYVSNQPFYSNETLWWRLPPRRGPARLFSSGAETRLDATGSLCLAQGGIGPVGLRVPDPGAAIRASLGIGGRRVQDRTLEWVTRDGPFAVARPSDKGLLAAGVIGLFGGLQPAGSFFQDKYWRSVVEEISGRGEHSDAARRGIIESRLRKRLRIGQRDDVAAHEISLERLTALVLQEGREQRTRQTAMTFEDLHSRFDKQSDPASPDEKPVPGGPSTEDQLLWRLTELVHDGVFLQGAWLGCDRCGHRAWVTVDELRVQSACRGCGACVQVQPTVAWSFRLNELIVKAAAFQGCISVISTLHDLRMNAREAFFYAPGLELLEHAESREPAAELDLVCLSDGRLVVGEVKTRSSDFTGAKLEKLARVSSKLQLDEIVVAAFYDNDNKLRSVAENLQGILGSSRPSVRAVAPAAHVFRPSWYVL